MMLWKLNVLTKNVQLLETKNSYWRKVFPKKLKEFILNKTHTCTYFIIIFLIFKQIYKTDISIENLKTYLKTIYNEYMDK